MSSRGFSLEVCNLMEMIDMQTSNYIIIHLVHKYLFSIYYILDMRLGASSLKVNKPQVPAFMELMFKLRKQTINEGIQKMTKCM